MKLLSKDGEKGGRIKEIVSVAVLAIAIAFTAYVMVMNIRGKAVTLFGYSVLRVVTGSMEPTIFTGDYILVHETDPKGLTEGDIITYYTEDEEIKDLLVTHRIIKVNEDGTFITQGDANPVADDIPVKAERVLGKYIQKARFFGMISSFGDMRKLLLFLVIIPILFIAVYETKTLAKLVVDYKKDNDPAEEEQKEQEIERIRREAIEEYKKQKEQEANGEEGQEEHE